MKDIEYGSGIIRVTKSEFKGNTYIDIRKYYLDKDTDEYKPTKKGISIPENLVEEVLKSLKEVSS